MAEIAGCHGCDNAQWDADGCTCRIDGLLVGNPARGCTYRIYDEQPETVSEEYERGFKDGFKECIKSECLEELKPLMVELVKGCTEVIKGIAPMLIDKAELSITHAISRWIPCSERLPAPLQNVIVCTVINTVTVAWLNGEGWTFADTGNGHTENWGFDMVKYWMSLPEPQKGEQK